MKLGKCIICDCDFSYETSQTLGKFCSRQCSGIYKNKIAVESGLATTKPARLYMLRYKHYSCDICKISEWNDTYINLQVDHIDGNTKNSLPSNLRWLCPNCHSQTVTWGINNIKVENKKNLSTSLNGNKRKKK